MRFVAPEKEGVIALAGHVLVTTAVMEKQVPCAVDLTGDFRCRPGSAVRTGRFPDGRTGRADRSRIPRNSWHCAGIASGLRSEQSGPCGIAFDRRSEQGELFGERV